MSSTYHLLCMSHDPATVITELRSGATDNTRVKEVLPTPAELERTHPLCDFAISRTSGAPIELGCLGFGDCPCGGHQGIKWVRIEWLKILVIAQDARAEDISKIRGRPELECWSDKRLHRLRHYLED